MSKPGPSPWDSMFDAEGEGRDGGEDAFYDEKVKSAN